MKGVAGVDTTNTIMLELYNNGSTNKDRQNGVICHVSGVDNSKTT